MICLEILLNGERLCLAGIEPGVLSTHVTAWQGGDETEREPIVHFHVMGNSDGKRFDWTESGSQESLLKVGDEVTVRVIEADAPDEGTRYHPRAKP